MKIAVIGGGAVGLTYAAFLAPVTEIVVKTHEKVQAESISRDGIKLTLAGEIEEINDVGIGIVFPVHGCREHRFRSGRAQEDEEKGQEEHREHPHQSR